MSREKKMYLLETEIIIDAPVERVWKIFSKTEDFSDWSPFFREITGVLKEGNRIKVVMAPPGSESMTFKPKVLKYIEKKEIRWLGRLILPGLFDGEHVFQLIDIEGKKTQFIQKEIFKGILVGLAKKQIDGNIKKGFMEFNEKLKAVCEK